MFRYNFQVQRIRKNGEWQSSVGLPQFWVAANDPESARDQAHTILDISAPSTRYEGAYTDGESVWDLVTGKELR